MTKITGVHHIDIRTPGFDRSVAFYHETLGLAVASTWSTKDGRAALIEIAPGSYIEIFERPVAGYSGEPALFHFALRTDDVTGITERVRAAGYKVTVEPLSVAVPASIGPMQFELSFVEGPDRESIEFMTSSPV